MELMMMMRFKGEKGQKGQDGTDATGTNRKKGQNKFKMGAMFWMRQMELDLR